MPCILLLEDEKPVRLMLRRVLEGAGHRVVEAHDGRQGIAAFQDTRIDLVLTDILMPEKDGIQALIEIQRLSPETPVIAMSGGGRTRTTEYLQLAARLGAERILKKPFRRGELIEAIESCIGKAAKDA